MEHSDISEREVARYWDRNASVWADHVRRGWDAYREHFNNPAMLAFIGDLAGKTVLDAGCGEGHNTRLLARHGARVVGVDISAKMIELARQEEEREPLGIRYELGSYSDLAMFDDDFFDRVVSFMALMDGPNFEGAVGEIFRVLRPGGELAFNITHPCFATRGFGWLEDEAGKPIKLTVGGYFDDRSWVEHWKFSQAPSPEDVMLFAVPRFPRTLSEYVNTLIDAGFALTGIQEPRPSTELCQQHPWLQRWRDHASLLLYVRAAKPAV